MKNVICKKVIKLSILTLPFFIISSYALKTPELPSQITYPVTIAGGTSHNLVFRFDRLVPGVTYDITCHYETSPRARDKPLLINTQNNTEFPVDFNRFPIPPGFHGGHLIFDRSADIKIQALIPNQIGREIFNITNVDSPNTYIDVGACFAKAVFNKSKRP